MWSIIGRLRPPTAGIALVALITLLSPGLAATNQAPVIAFGLTNAPLGPATLRFQGSDLVVTAELNGGSNSTAAASPAFSPASSSSSSIPNLGSAYYGVSVQLGEADSGLFFYPYSYSGLYDGGLMVGRLYGQLEGQPDELLTTLYGLRTDYATFYVGSDFTPLGASRVTFEVFVGETQVGVSSNQIGEFVIYSDSEYAPRANPLLRLADGSLAAVIELSGSRQLMIPGMTEEYGIWGDRIVIRPEAPALAVDFASRLEVTAGSGLNQFVVTDERLGVFRRGHRALGRSLFNAAAGRLTVVPAPAAEGESDETGTGVLVELASNRHFDLDFEPVELAVEGAALSVGAVGSLGSGGGELVGQATVANTGGAISVSGNFSQFLDGLLVSVHRDEIEVGTVLSPTTKPSISVSGAPRVAGFDAAAESAGGSAGLAVRLDRLVTFFLPDGSSFEGTEIRFSAADPGRFDRLHTFHVTSMKVPAFTIVAESEVQTIYLSDYLPEFAVPASAKTFEGENHGVAETLSQSVSGIARDGQSLIALVDVPSADSARSQFYSFRDGALQFHGSAEGALELFSVTGVRLVPTTPVLGQTYHGVGSFSWHNGTTGADSPVMVTATARAAGVESIMVPVGTYDALRLEATFVFGSSPETGAPIMRVSTLWLANGVGLIRRQETDHFGDGSTRTRSAELTAFNLVTSSHQRPVANVGASIRVASTGAAAPAEPMSIQWFKDAVPVPGGTNLDLMIAPVDFDDAGEYSLVRSNAAGQVSVLAATLQVIPFNAPPTFRAIGRTIAGWVNSTHIAVDSAGNTYLAGTFAGTVEFGGITLTSPTSADPVFVVKYDPAGNVVWARDGGGPRIDSLTGIGVDAADNVYLAGGSRGEVIFGSSVVGGETTFGTWVAKMNPAGDFLWATAPGGTGYHTSEDMAVDAAGNTYLVGAFSGTMIAGGTTLTNTMSFRSMFALKVDSAGNITWARQPGSTGYGRPYTVALDPEGGLVAGGYFYGTLEFGSTLLDAGAGQRGFLVTMDANGAFVQARSIGAGVSGTGFDAAGNLYLHGWYDNSSLVGDLPLLASGQGSTTEYLARLGTDGAVVWARATDDLEHYIRKTMFVDATGNLYLSGSFYNQATITGTTFIGSGFLVSKFDRDGHRIWAKQVTGSSGASHGPITTDASGNLYLSGQFYGAIRLGDATFQGTSRLSPFLVKLGAVAPPEIEEHPASQIVNLGEPASLNVTATGDGLLYQWRRDGILIDGANEAVFTINNARTTDAGSYTVTVQNDGGAVVSTPAQLQVNAPDAGAFSFGAASYTVGEASGGATIEIVRDGATASPATVGVQTANKSAQAGLDYISTVATLGFAAGETTKSISIPIVADGLYETEETIVLRLHHPGPGATLGTPNVATINITDDDPPTPVILTQPRNRAVIEGRTGVFMVEANGEAPLTYQWRKDGEDLPGAIGSSLVIPNVQGGDAGIYTVVVRNAAGEVSSDPATLTVRFLPVIVLQPQSISVPYGEPVTLSVLASNGVAVTTNTFGGSGLGTAEARFQVPTSGGRAVLRLSFDFEQQSDVIRVYDGAVLLYDSSYVIGTGAVSVDILAGTPRSIEIVINVDSSGGEDGWSFQGALISRPIDYLWQKDNQFIWGATGPTYYLPVTRAWDAGTYAVMVTDHVGMVVSQAATLTVTPPILRVNATTNGPAGIQLWWVSPDHRPEFISDLNGAADFENWMMLPDFFSGMTVESPGDQGYFRLRAIND